MQALKKQLVKKELVTATGTTVLIVLFSVSLWILPPLGNLINPNGPFWDAAKRSHDYATLEEQAIPDLAGTNVTVYRDRYGVPHIYASEWQDLFLAYGYVMAQDRFFEMTLLKMVGYGRLSEVVGTYGVDIDKYLRTISLWKAAEDTIAVAEENKDTYAHHYAILQQYCKGVNLWASTHRNQLPIEFSLLDLPVEQWTMVDTALMANLAGLMLSWSTADLSIEEAQRTLGPYLADASRAAKYGSGALDFLFPQWNMSFPYETPILPDNHSMQSVGGSFLSLPIAEAGGSSDLRYTMLALQKLDEKVRTCLSVIPTGEWIGSNNWVINGTLSATGKPILCGDPHLMYMTPSVWYEVHLVCPLAGYTEYLDPKTNDKYSWPNGYNVYGVGFPGTPIVLIGHNEHCAWSETNTGSDSFVDFYQETLNADESKYYFNGQWEDVVVKSWPIKVKNGELLCDVPFEIRYTRHGPLMTGALSGSEALGQVAGEFGLPSFALANLSVKWIGYNNSKYYNQLVAFDLLNRAQNVTGMKRALDTYPNPPQNFVVADDAGNIGMICAGLYPIRAKNGVASANYTGTYVQPGDGTGEEWVGFIPPAHLPHCINPLGQAYLASANQRTIAAKNYNYSIGREWAPDWRARSINRYLNTSDPGSPYFGKKISFEDLQNIQYSSYDIAAQSYVPIILASYDGLSADEKAVYSADVKAAINELRAWNNSASYKYRMEKHLVAPTIFDKWVKFLAPNVWADEWTDAGMKGSYPIDQVLEYLVREGASTDPWFDDITTTTKVETKEDVVLATLVDAVAQLASKHGSLALNPSPWIWGARHVFGTIGIPLIFNALLNRRTDTIPVPGSSRTLNNAPKYDITLDLGPIHIDLSDFVLGGPSWRQVVDLNAVEKSVGILPGGVSEDIASPHYFDQAPLWAAGNYKQLLFFATPQAFPASEVKATLILRRA